jgi:CBS-domain-containing membrane protein
MAGTLAGVTRSPFTSIVFAIELTHEQSLLLPLLATCTVAHLVSAAFLKRSILTEKVARRGFHVMREYAVDPLEALYVREAMAQDIRIVPPSASAAELRSIFAHDPVARRQRLYPVVDGAAGLVGVVGWSHLVGVEEGVPVEAVMERRVVVAYADEVLRTVASRMAELQLGAMPVVDRDDPRAVIGVVTEFELLAGRRRQLEEERRRERPLRLTPAIARTTRPVRRRVRARWPG